MTLDSLYRTAPPWLQHVFLNAYAMRVRWHRYGRRLDREVRAAAERERWSPERLRAFQNERLRHVVAVAAARSPFYQDRFRAAGVRPGDLRSVEDLEGLPLLTKDDVRDHGPELMTAPRPRLGWLHGHTSGTTGTPLGLWYDRHTCIVTNAMDARQKRWAGMEPGDWVGLLLGRAIVDPGRERPPFWQRNHVLKQVWFSSFHLHPEKLPHYVAEIRRRSLRFLEGYPSTLYILARHLLDAGETLPMRATLTSSETLHTVQREAIEAAFDAPIFDFFGHAERTVFATECEVHEGKHISEDFGWVEVVDEAGQPVPEGEPGYLVGTSLHNVAMPMIRYRTSDLSRIVPEACPCGRTHRRIADVATKAEDIVVTPDGRMISPSTLTHPFKPFDTLRKSQIIQERPDRLRVLLVPTGGFTDDDRRTLHAGLIDRLGGGMQIDFEIVDDIPQEQSGKFRWVVSKVRHNTRFEWEAPSHE